MFLKNMLCTQIKCFLGSYYEKILNIYTKYLVNLTIASKSLKIMEHIPFSKNSRTLPLLIL